MNTRLATNQDLAIHETHGLAARALHALTATRAGLASTVLRVTLGAVMFPHGAQKVLGWFGGYGISGTMGFLTGQVGLP
ncbi:MAG TPA: DoxX family membrane protein, partial [Candidatus Krumholzibacteria bacterium]|nr:DoxX family membrane protein [Candidatus Krumholzibacteria bacterium]